MLNCVWRQISVTRHLRLKMCILQRTDELVYAHIAVQIRKYKCTWYYFHPAAFASSLIPSISLPRGKGGQRTWRTGGNSRLPWELSTAAVGPCPGLGHPGEGLLMKGAVPLASEKLAWLSSHGFQLWAILGKSQLEKIVHGPLALSSPTKASEWSACRDHLCTYNSGHPWKYTLEGRFAVSR